MAEQAAKVPDVVLPSGDDHESPDATAESRPETSEKEELLEARLLVEDVSIDGMCGVY